MKEIKFTETGTLLIVIFLVVLGFVQWSYFSQYGSKPLTLTPYLILTGLFSLILLLFYKLTIQVGKNKLEFIYGIGMIKITKKIDNILSIEELKTPWYWGLGIRMTPKGWLFNIQSRESLCINYMFNGKENRILVGSKDREMLKNSLAVQLG